MIYIKIIRVKEPAPPKNLDSPEIQQLLLPSLGLDAVALAQWMQTIPEAMVESFRSASKPKDYRSGEVLFHKGDVVNGLYFIESGEVRSSTLTEDGREFVLYLFEPGSCVGLISVLDAAPSPSTCRAWCDTRVRLLPRSKLNAILQQQPQYYQHFVALLLRWVRGLISVLEDQAVLSVRERLAKRLLQLAKLYGKSSDAGIVLPFKLPQEELGLLLGATRQSVHQQLKAFRAKGWVSMEQGFITICDSAALTRCIQEGESKTERV